VVSRALTATGQPERALVSADRCLETCLRHGIADFDLAYAHEARARALHALGRVDEAAAAWRAARDVPVAAAEDRAIVEADFAALDSVLG
jgi:tetratricopeptide (TPR) repeat protein